VDVALQSPAKPLESGTRAMMERSFGWDFSRVRVHDGELAATSAAQVDARAYTVGRDVVFAAGQYEPHTPAGRRLIAHELTHVLQQGATGESAGLVQRDDTSRDAPNAKGWNGPAKCPSDFCQPLGSNMAANDRRAAYWSPFTVGIAFFVNSRVVPIWNDWAYGGSSSVRDLTSGFGTDFTFSPTTLRITAYLIDELKKALTASPPTVPPAGVKLDISTLIPAEIKAIDTPGHTWEMNFSIPGDIPGNLAGGIGKDEAANPVGKNPSPQDDARIVKGDVEVFDIGSALQVVPHLNFRVVDTVDLCPGDCGSSTEQKATVEMSRWEATGISGDVPFTVDFPAPVMLTLPFFVPKSGATPP
jgi:hypothetical protein